MQQNTTINKKIIGQNLKFALIVSRFNTQVTNGLKEGCLKALREHKVNEDNFQVFEVPGAFEIPLIAQKLAKKKYDAIICLGAVIRGETPHFEYVAKAVTEGILQTSLNYDLPVLFGVLTTDNLEQALARSGDNENNKGYEVAVAAMEMVQLIKSL